MRIKISSLNDALNLIKDRSVIAMTTSIIDDAPMAFLRNLIKNGQKDLSFVGVTGAGLNIDMVIGAGIVSEVDTCSISLGDFGPAPNFQRYITKASQINLKDNTCGVMYSMVQAGVMGVPFVPVRGLWGTDIFKNRRDLKIRKNPFNKGEDIIIASAIKPDVAIFHGLKADKFGNTITAPQRDDLMLAQASSKVVVTVEEIVQSILHAPEPSKGSFIPGIYVDAVVELPGGAHPGGCYQSYDSDVAHINEYIQSSKTHDLFLRYLEKYVFSISA
jgi:glutaconate CoA-transferase subunit A